MSTDNIFSVADRERVHERVLHWATSDGRIVAGAVVGSLALDDAGDRWSDLDLTFAVAADQPLPAVLEDWTRRLAAEFDAVQLFDLPVGASIYRVFLLPGCLQFDLSFTPATEFGALGPQFKLLFGRAVKKPPLPSPSAEVLFGYAVHHTLRARFCIERGRWWQAEYWISGVRDYALHLACRRRGLPAAHGRGFDELPAEVRELFTGALVASLTRAELLRALGCAVRGLLAEAEEVEEVATKVAPQLERLVAAWNHSPEAA
jgi:hypothetical protein